MHQANKSSLRNQVCLKVLSDLCSFGHSLCSNPVENFLPFMQEKFSQIQNIFSYYNMPTKQEKEPFFRYTENHLLHEAHKFTVLLNTDTENLPNYNICYIYAALNPLLAIDHFTDLVPVVLEEHVHDCEPRQIILDSFHAFLTAKRKNFSSEIQENNLFALRRKIFQVKLDQGGFLRDVEEGSFQDVGSFLELFLYVVGHDYIVKTTKVYPIQNDKDYTHKEETRQSILYLKANNSSLQSKLDSFALPTPSSLQENEALFYNNNSLRDFIESNQILGSPPEILVFQVNNYPIQPEHDQVIDCSTLFENRPKELYQLTGFMQNHKQQHWTSVIFSENQWKYCDNKTWQNISGTDAAFQSPASYLVYQRKPYINL